MILLDSHIWFWWVTQESQRISARIADTIATAERVGVCSVSCFELALAHKRGRLELPIGAREWFRLALDASNIELVPLTPSIASRAVGLTEVHRDPFDRIIIASALEIDATLISVDGSFASYPEISDRLLNH